MNITVVEQPRRRSLNKPPLLKRISDGKIYKNESKAPLDDEDNDQGQQINNLGQSDQKEIQTQDNASSAQVIEE